VTVAPSLPDLSSAPASTPAGAVVDSPAEPPVAADVGMVEAPPPVVIPDRGGEAQYVDGGGTRCIGCRGT
jgi:hypothetical protein